MAILHQAKRVFLKTIVQHSGSHTKALFKRAAEKTSEILHGGNPTAPPPNIVCHGDRSLIFRFTIGKKEFVVEGTRNTASLTQMTSRGGKVLASLKK